MKDESVRVKAIKVSQKGGEFFLSSIKAKYLVDIGYVAVRGRDSESGAVQRYLNPRRISSVKEYTVHQGNFPSSLVLNWKNEDAPIVENDDGTVLIPVVSNSAQLIDGQHRLSGIEEAIKENEQLGELEVPVSIYIGLETKQCANIFLSINTEQKPVPRSLVYDLYSIVDDEIVDPAASRARDIVDALNNEEESPYYREIKVPGSPRRKGGIALSTAVTAIKPLVEKNGSFEQVGITAFEQQRDVVRNFFKALARPYGKTWNDTKNAFMFASGFTGAVEFLDKRMISYCYKARDFTAEYIGRSLKMTEDSLVLQSEVKGVQGKEAPKRIFEMLNDVFEPEIETVEIKT